MFNRVWEKIEHCQGQEFHTKSGKAFRYRVKYKCVVPDHTDRNLPISHFEAVYAMGPVPGPGAIARQDPRIQGPSYIWAILNDSRIAR